MREFMKKYKILNKLILLLFAVALFNGCTTSDNKGGSAVQIVYHAAETKPQIVVYSKYVPINTAQVQSYNINASVIPAEESSSKLIYSSSDASVASVTESGSVTIHKTGTAVINISLEKDSSISNQVIINAYEGSVDTENTVPVIAVAVDKTYVSINKGSGLAVFPSVRPGNATNKELVYLSNNSSIANVDENGLIQGVNTGNASIIIYAKSNPEKYAFISVDVTEENASSGSDFTAPDGLAPIDLNADPMSLIAKYKILNYAVNGAAAEQADEDSGLRVNVDLSQLSSGIVKILMYVKLNGKEVRLIQKKNIGDYGSIPDIFTSLGAKITGDYTMEFTLDPVNYTEFARQGMVNKGDTLVLNIGKIESLTPAGGLGNDIEFDVSTVPVEGENTDNTDNQAPDNNENTGSEENTSTAVQVESIVFDIHEYSALNLNETVQINAEVYPETAENKTLSWSSSAQDVASVDRNGLVTIHKNGSAVITAKSSNGVKAQMNIVPVTAIDDFKLDVDSKNFILNVDTDMQLTYTVYPSILNGVTQNVQYSSNNDKIAQVDAAGNIKALSEGETVITVTIGDIVRECFVNVLPEDAASTPVTDVILSENEGRYTPTFGTFKLNPQVMPEEAGDKRLTYVSSNDGVASVNAAGVVTIKGFGQADITITSFNNPNAQAVYRVIVETLPTKVVYERFDYGVEIGKTAKIIPVYEGSPSNTNTTYTIENQSIAQVNASTGEVTGISSGSTTLTAVTENGKTATTVINVYNPVKAGNVSSLRGTYQIIDFSQYNGTLNVGTNEYGGVERMIGEMTIEVSGNTVYIKSKIQMDSSTMNNYNGIGSDKAKQGQFQYTEYTAADYNQNGFGSAGEKSAYVTHDGDMLKLYQEWKEMGIATVQVNTWIKKKSDTIKDLKSGYFHWGTNGINGDTRANAVAHHPDIKVPEIEPYYTYGLITK